MRLCSYSFLATVLLCAVALQLGAQGRLPDGGAPLTVDQVIARLEQKDHERAQALREFEGSRTYHLEYHGMGGSKEADMKVQMNFQAPASKRFTVISQDGSKFIIDHVLKKLLQSEQEAQDPNNRRATALSRENYEFSLLRYEQRLDGSHVYVLDVKPRTKNKFLYQGTIVVNADDFAVMRIEAAPAKNPSFWIKKTQIEHTYVKVGDFWLPAQNRTESQILVGGRASLTIDYLNYRIISSTPLGAPERATAMQGERASNLAQKMLIRDKAATQIVPANDALAEITINPK